MTVRSALCAERIFGKGASDKGGKNYSMTRNGLLYCLGWLWVGVIFLSGVGSASEHTEADAIWSKVVKKIEQAQDYVVGLSATGPKGSFKAVYYCIRPNRVRMEFSLDSARYPGATMVYDPFVSEDHMLLRSAQGSVLARSIHHQGILDFALHRSLLDRLIEKVNGYLPVLKESDELGEDKITLEFKVSDNKKLMVWIAENGDIVRFKEFSGSDVVWDYAFSDYRWNISPRIDL